MENMVLEILEYKQKAGIWMNVVLSKHRVPVLRSIYCCGYRYMDLDKEVVVFQRPNPRGLQFICLDALQLDVSIAEAVDASDNSNEQDPTISPLSRKLLHHTSLSEKLPTTKKMSEIKVILNQVGINIMEPYVTCNAFIDNRLDQLCSRSGQGFKKEV